MASRRLLLGRISGVFGIAGQVKLQSFTDPPENLLKYRPWILVQGQHEQTIERPSGRMHGKSLVAALPDCAERDRAAAMVGAEIWVERARLPRAKPGEYYWSDLEGLEVVNEAGVVLGTVSHLFATGANDVLVVKGERERLIPFVSGQVVKQVDLDARRMRVDWEPEF